MHDSHGGRAATSNGGRATRSTLPELLLVRGSWHGLFAVAAGLARPHFYEDCTPQAAAWAQARLRPQSQAVLQATDTRAAWREVPSTYIVASEDRVLPEPMQRAFAALAGTVLDRPGGHSPMLARPARLAAALAGIAARADLG